MDYINKTSKLNSIGSLSVEKCNAILEDGAIEIVQPLKWIENIVCVVDNGEYGAAAYVHDKDDFDRCSNPNDRRSLRWFIWSKVEKYID